MVDKKYCILKVDRPHQIITEKLQSPSDSHDIMDMNIVTNVVTRQTKEENGIVCELLEYGAEIDNC